MLTKKDFLEYLDELGHIENEMANVYQEIIENAEDKKIVASLTTMLEDEKEHCAKVFHIIRKMVEEG